jgi:hypothetical protein
LSKYLTDLSERIEFYRSWIQRGKPGTNFATKIANNLTNQYY